MIGLGQEDEIEEITLRPEIWWHDVVYHEADHCIKWPHSANIRIFWSRPAEGAVLWTSCFKCYSDPHNLKIIDIFINTQQIFMFKASILITFLWEVWWNLIISCLNFSFKKCIIWLQLHPKLIASDYITIGRPLGRTKAVHLWVTPQGAWGGGSEGWLANPWLNIFQQEWSDQGFQGRPADMAVTVWQALLRQVRGGFSPQ